MADEGAARAWHSTEEPSAPPLEESPYRGIPTDKPAAMTTGASGPNRTVTNRGPSLDVAPLILKIVAIGFALISLGVLASDTTTVHYYDYYRSNYPDYGPYRDYEYDTYTYTYTFTKYYYLVSLLVADVLAVVFVTATVALTICRFSCIAFLIIDLIMSYLLLSASTCALTRMVPASPTFLFVRKAYVATAFSLAAFFALALAVLLTKRRATVPR